MLIKLLKFSFRATVAIGVLVVFPLLRLAVRLSSWRNRPIDLGMALLNDEDVIKAATQAGAAGALVQLRQVLTMMAQSVGNRMESRPALTQEDIDWAMFIQNYGENPQPDMVPAYLAYIKKSGTTGSTELPTWGALQSLCRRHRELKSQWVRDFVDVFDQMERKAEAAEPNRPGWNDYFMVQWFVLREDQIAHTIAERTKIPGMVGSTCTWMANSVAHQIPAFDEALERVGYEFPKLDLNAGLAHDAEVARQAIPERVNITPERKAENEAYARAHPRAFARFEEGMRKEMERVGMAVPDFSAAVKAERKRYPMTVEGCNEFLRSLAGATITRAEMMSLQGGNEDENEERVEIISSAGMFCIVAPDLGFSFTERTERGDPAPAAKQNGSASC